MEYSATSFDTVLGPVAIAWSNRGIRHLQLPENTEAATRTLIENAVPIAEWRTPPRPIQAAIRRIARHLEGEHDTLDDVAVDLDGIKPFRKKIYRLLKKVSPGCTTTYGELARRVGSPSASRAVGSAMAHNRTPLLFPCHRVLTSEGSLGNFSAPGGQQTKLRLLTLEGANLNRIAQRGQRELQSRDPLLGQVMKRVGSYRPTTTNAGDPLTSLVRAIVSQQLSAKAASTIFKRLLTSCNIPADTPPTEQRISARKLLSLPDATLRGAGLSERKAAYVRELSEHVLRRKLDLQQLAYMHDEAVIDLLCNVRGIGRWSAQMFLMFQLGRLDVLACDDLGLRKGAAIVHRLAQLPSKSDLAELGDAWRPFRSIASWYLWRATDLDN